MSWFSQAFGKNKNPANEANRYMSQIPGAMQPYYQPFIDQGKGAGDKLSAQYDQMTQDPGAFMANLGKGYKESPGYQFKLQQAMNAGNNAASAGGMLGTPASQQQNMQMGNDIASQDYNDYMQNLMGAFGMGQQGQQKFQEQGYGASTGYGENLGNVLGSQGQLAYNAAAGDNQRRGNNWANLFKTAGTFAPYFL